MLYNTLCKSYLKELYSAITDLDDEQRQYEKKDDRLKKEKKRDVFR